MMKKLFTILLCVVFLACAGGKGFALTIPASEDSIGYNNQITASGNAAIQLAVDVNRKAFIYFNLNDIPINAVVRWAKLRMFLPTVTAKGSGLSIYQVGGVWNECKPSAMPYIQPYAVASIPADQLGNKRFVTADVTATVQSWISMRALNEGFAIAPTLGYYGPSVLVLTSKEGPGLGIPADLDIEFQPEAKPITADQLPASLNQTLASLNQTSASIKSFLTPTISSQPALNLTTGALSATTQGLGNLTYQWYKDGVAVSGATSTTLPLNMLSGGSANYTLKTTNGFASTTSASFAFNPTVLVPSIVSQPALDLTTRALSATAQGLGNLTYQWYKDGVAVSGATSATLPLNMLSSGSANYTLKTTNGFASTTSASFAFNPTVLVPSIVSQPALDLTTRALSATAQGLGNLTYQWYKDGVAVSGATSATLPLQGLSSGSYMLKTTNGFATVTSSSVAFDSSMNGITTGNFTTSASMLFDRSGHTATRLQDGRVLVAGGVSYSGATLSSAEIYDPITGTWTQTQSMGIGRASHIAALLRDGRVLVACSNYSGTYSSVEIYDPTTGHWSPTGSLNHGRFSAKMVELQDGRLFIIGDGGISGDAEIYDPTTGTWTVTEKMVDSQVMGATTLNDGRVLVTGTTQNFDESQFPFHYVTFTSVSQIFNPTTGHWTATQPMQTARMCYETSPLQDGKVLVVGGFSLNGVIYKSLSTAELFDPLTGVWSMTGQMSESRQQRHQLTRLQNGKVLVTGGMGESGNSYLASAEVYDPSTRAWTKSGSMSVTRAAHALVLLNDGSVLVVGGDVSGMRFPSSTTSVERYNQPPTPFSGTLTDGITAYYPFNGTLANAVAPNEQANLLGSTLNPSGWVDVYGTSIEYPDPLKVATDVYSSSLNVYETDLTDTAGGAYLVAGEGLQTTELVSHAWVNRSEHWECSFYGDQKSGTATAFHQDATAVRGK